MTIAEDIVFRKLKSSDLTAIKGILHYWFSDYPIQIIGQSYDDEFEEYFLYIKKSLEKHSKSSFFVLEQNNRVLGIFGYTSDLDVDIKQYASDSSAIQFRFLFLDPMSLRRGLGTYLVTKILQEARNQGFTQGYFFSHERFKETSWNFHQNRKDFLLVDTIVKHHQKCRVYKVVL